MQQVFFFQFIEHLQSDECGKVISKTSFARPVSAFKEISRWCLYLRAYFSIYVYLFIQAVSVYYLNILMDNLSCVGYVHLCLPVTRLLRCLAKYVIENELLLKLFHWRSVEMNRLLSR